MDTNKTVDNTIFKTESFYIYLIAMNYFKGRNEFDLARFKEFLKKTYGNNKEYFDALDKAINTLVKNNIINSNGSTVVIIDEVEASHLLLRNRSYFNMVSNICDAYEEFRVNTISRMYDMMIDSEAQDAYHERERKEMESEFFAHQYYDRFYR